MGDFFGSVRKSPVFRPYSNHEESSLVSSSIGNLTEKIGSCLAKSKAGRGLGFSSFKIQSPPTITEEEKEEETRPIRWRKGELIGCGAFGHVYMGMNLDSGELLAVKQVMIGVSSASKEKAQAHIRELEEEVKLLKNLSHTNIVRYLGTAREDDTLNILLEFVPGGSISSLLGKFGSFPEAVIRMYTKQLLQGLEYLHNNKIIHRDIKGANILVDNKGCIKLADFGASKQVAKLATVDAAKSMKGTPYWMAPEVIVQSGHSFSADIWSVGCTVIEMATGKPPWSQQYQEVAAMFHVGTTKSHPPIPEHLSYDAKKFLLKCLQREPNLRPTASELLQHPFVAREYQDSRTLRNSFNAPTTSILPISRTLKASNLTPVQGVPRYEEHGNEAFSILFPEMDLPLRPLWEAGSSSNSMCQFDDAKSFNPVSEPFDDWSSKFELNPEQRMDFDGCVSESICNATVNTSISDAVYEQDDEVTESKIRAFLDEKALELKKLQTPLFEEFELKNNGKEPAANTPKLPPKSPSKAASHMDFVKKSISPLLSSRRYSCVDAYNNRILKEIQSPRHNELGEPSSVTFSKKEDEWRKELADELESLRQQGTGAVRASPNLGRSTSRKRDRFRFTSPEK